MRRSLLIAAMLIVVPALAHAEPAGTVADRVAVRYVTPETGGAAQPRFLTEREVALFARIEAMLEQTPLEGNEYPERYVRAGIDRIVARSMLSALLVQRGVEPPDLPRLTLEARGELEARLGGASTLADALRREGIEDEELSAFLRDAVRASFYIDRAITPILAVSEDALREAFRSMLHPFRGQKFDDIRVNLRRWLVTERLRAAELEFLQSARTRIKLTSVRLVPRPGHEHAAGPAPAPAPAPGQSK